MNRKKFNAEDLKFIDEGEESLVRKLCQGVAIKLFRDPDDKDFRGDADAARKRIQTMQTKLFEFPKNLPERVLTLQELATDQSGKIIGYTMRYLDGATDLEKYGEKEFREKMGIDNKDIVNNIILPVFRDLHHTVSDIHELEVVIGDFNDTNVLVKDNAAYIIDADSFQFRSPSRFYPGVMLKGDFTDPLLILYDKSSQKLKLKKGALASTDTDWYAYNVMLVRSLLLVKPYGGTYKSDENITDRDRIRERITIFHKDEVSHKSDMELPEWAIHPDMLPDDLLQHFYEVFGKNNKREPFPAYLLDMRWTRCSQCGAEHARARCPNCHRKKSKGFLEGFKKGFKKGFDPFGIFRPPDETP